MRPYYLAIAAASFVLVAAIVYHARHESPQRPCSGPCVTEVIDGDTLVVDGTTTVRLIGIDTPESVDPDMPVQCGALAAKARLTQLALGQPVELRYDQERTDDYGRTLAYAFVHDHFLNATLAREGLARYYDFEPNTKYADTFHQLVYRAIDQKRGLWGSCPGAMRWATN